MWSVDFAKPEWLDPGFTITGAVPFFDPIVIGAVHLDDWGLIAACDAPGTAVCNLRAPRGYVLTLQSPGYAPTTAWASYDSAGNPTVFAFDPIFAAGVGDELIAMAELGDVYYLRPGDDAVPPPPEPSEKPASVLPWVIGGTVGLLALVALARRGRGRRRR